MKKTVDINLGGFIFHIDDDACNKLEKYLANIERGFDNRDEAKEIMSDIEMRIAEIFKERIGNSREVVNLLDVDYAISVMGMPEDINNENKGESKEQDKTNSKFGKRLYRDADNRVLGGVASGIAAYFGIDPVIIRIIFVVFIFMGLSILVYLILWVAMPEALTTAQKLEMKGEAVNVQNIEKNIREEFHKVKESVKKNRTWESIGDFIKNILEILGNLFLGIFKVVGGILGVLLIVLGIFVLIALSDVLFLDGSINSEFPSQLMSMFVNTGFINLFIVLIFMVIGIPIIKFSIFIIRKMIGSKKPIKAVNISLTVVWILSIISLTFLSLIQARHYTATASVNQTLSFDSLQTKAIVIDMKNHSLNNINNDNQWYYNPNNPNLGLYSQVWVDIETTNDSIPFIKMIRQSRGKNKKNAIALAKEIPSVTQINDSIVSINSDFFIPQQTFFRFQKAIVKIYVPKNFKLIFKNGVTERMRTINMNGNSNYDDLEKEAWKMTESGLEKY